jgi:hypothetical protein
MSKRQMTDELQKTSAERPKVDHDKQFIVFTEVHSESGSESRSYLVPFDGPLKTLFKDSRRYVELHNSDAAYHEPAENNTEADIERDSDDENDINLKEFSIKEEEHDAIF